MFCEVCLLSAIVYIQHGAYSPLLRNYLFIDDYSLGKIFSFVSACVFVCIFSVVSDLGGRLRTSMKSYYLRQ